LSLTHQALLLSANIRDFARYPNCAWRIGLNDNPQARHSLFQPKQFPQRFQQGVMFRFRRILGQGGYGAVQELVLQEAEGAFDLPSVGFAELAIEPAE